MLLSLLGGLAAAAADTVPSCELPVLPEDAFRFDSDFSRENLCAAAGVETALCERIRMVAVQRYDAYGIALSSDSSSLSSEPSPDSLLLSAAGLRTGQSICLSLDVEAAESASLARFEFAWSAVGGGDGRLASCRNGRVEASIATTEQQPEFVGRAAWTSPMGSSSPVYRLRWCYLVGSDRPSPSEAGARLNGLALSGEFSHSLTIAAPSTDNRQVVADHLVHRLPLSLELQSVAEGGGEPSMASLNLALRSRSGLVYISSDVLTVSTDTVAVAVELDYRIERIPGERFTAELPLWLPQHWLVRSESLLLIDLADGTDDTDDEVMDSVEIEIPAVAPGDNSVLLNGDFCKLFVPSERERSCALLVLPGNGVGVWRFVQSRNRLNPDQIFIGELTTTVPTTGPEAIDRACFEFLLRDNPQSHAAHIRFSWIFEPKGSFDFHIGDGTAPVATIGNAPLQLQNEARLFALQGDTLLRWCYDIESPIFTEVALEALSLQRFGIGEEGGPLRSPAPMLRAWRLLQQCQRNAITNCPASNMALRGLFDRAADFDNTEGQRNRLLGQLSHLLFSAGADLSGDGRRNEQDLRILLRYLAGLRGGALGAAVSDREIVEFLGSPDS